MELYILFLFVHNVMVIILKICLLILITKIIENTLATIRIVMIAKDQKVKGAILNGIIAFVWIISTTMVIVNIKDNVWKIFYFCLGSIIGSYLGSVIEERLEKKKKKAI